MRASVAAAVFAFVALGCTSTGGDEVPLSAAPTPAESGSAILTSPADSSRASTASPAQTATAAPPAATHAPTAAATITARVLADSLPVHVGGHTRTHVIGTLAAGTEVEALGFNKLGRDGLLALHDIGWVRYDAPAIALSVPAEAVGSYLGLLLGPAHPPGTRTQLPAIDRVLDLLDAGDAASLLALAPNRDYPCAGPGQFSGPTCPEGVPAGTPIAAFRSAACHGEYSVSAEPPLSRLVDRSAAPGRLFAVYATTEDYRRRFGEPAYLVVLAPAVGIGVTADGSIDLLMRSCGPETLLPEADLEFLLPPVTPALVEPAVAR